MEDFEQIKTYVTILSESLEKKSILLKQLQVLTEQQRDELSKGTDTDMEEIERLIGIKDGLITELTRLDQGFEIIYEKVKEGIALYQQELKDILLKIQKLIGQITDQAVKLQTLEIENKHKMELFFSTKRNQIKTFKVSSKTAANYYKNMSGHAQDSTYFMDKRK